MAVIETQGGEKTPGARIADESGAPASGSPLRYLITGGAGFIGSHLADRLTAGGHSVLVLDDLSSGSPANLGGARAGGSVELVQGSVLDAGLVQRCMRRVDVCVHLAAALGVKRVVDRPLETLLANVRGTDIVMASASRFGRRVLFASSSEVYGKRTAAGLTEDADCTIGSPARSRWSYAIAKQFGEALGYAHAQDAGLELIVVRFFNVVGPRQSSAYGMVLPQFVAQALAGEPLTIYGDGSQTRCFTSVHDAVSAVDGLLACETAGGATYNVGVSTPIRIDDLAHRVIARAGSPSGLVHIPYAAAYGPGYEELGRRVPDTHALRALTGWIPRHGVDEMIDQVISGRSMRRSDGRAPTSERVMPRPRRPVPAAA